MAKPGKGKRTTKSAAKSKKKAKAKAPTKATKKPKPGKVKRPPAAAVAARERRQRLAAAERKKDAQRKRKSERQRQRRAEQREASRIAARRPRDEREIAIEWLEYMTPPGFALDVVEAELAARTPWLVVGKFTPNDAISYAELAAVFQAWRDDLALESELHPQRVASIRIVYIDPNDLRGSGDSVVSHSGPWELVISESAHELDPENPDSLAARYSQTAVPYFYVYFAGEILKSSAWIPHYQRDARDS
jgi:hypothetical protein